MVWKVLQQLLLALQECHKKRNGMHRVMHSHAYVHFVIHVHEQSCYTIHYKIERKKEGRKRRKEIKGTNTDNLQQPQKL